MTYSRCRIDLEEAIHVKRPSPDYHFKVGQTRKPLLTTTLPSLHPSYKACCCKLSGQGGQSLAPSDKNVHNSRLCSEFSKITQIMQEIIMEKKERGDSTKF